MKPPDIPAIPIGLDNLLEEARLKLAIAREHVQELQSFGITNVFRYHQCLARPIREGY